MSKTDVLIAAIQQATSTTEIAELLLTYSGKQHHALTAVADHAPCLDATLVCLLLMGDVYPARILQNKNCPSKAPHWIARWAIGRLQSEAAKELVTSSEATLVRLIDDGHIPRASAEFDALLSVVFPPKKSTRLAERQLAAVRVVLRHPALGSEDVERLLGLKQALGDQPTLRAFFESPCVSLEQQRRIVTAMSDHGTPLIVADVAVEFDVVRRDPVSRPLLLKAALNPSVIKRRHLERFIADANPLDCRDLMQFFIKTWAEPALDFLEAHHAVIAPHLEPGDIEPLLNHDKPTVRSRALVCLGGITPTRDRAATRGHLMESPAPSGSAAIAAPARINS